MLYRQLTLKDIAKELNTSVSTVSRALKDHHSISPEMKKKVNDLASRWDYHPNPTALSLLKNKHYTIGVVVPEIAQNYFSIVMEGIEDAASQAGYHVMFCLSKEILQREINVVNTLLNNRIDGLIIAPSKETVSHEHLDCIINRGMPLIFIDRYCEAVPASRVLGDDYNGSFSAVEHLISTGRKRIAHIAGPEILSNSKPRLSGYLDALKKHKIPTDRELIVHCDLTQASAIDCINRLTSLKKLPDGVLTYNSSIAFQVMPVVKEQGLKIPDQIAFVGFANEPIISYIEPQLTTVIQPAYDIGWEAVNLFLDQQADEDYAAIPKIKILPTQLVIRGSSVKSSAMHAGLRHA
ncbi:MAG: LacI family DNA-binding transcriptional regulator [Chitinophagales bacterium]